MRKEIRAITKKARAKMRVKIGAKLRAKKKTKFHLGCSFLLRAFGALDPTSGADVNFTIALGRCIRPLDGSGATHQTPGYLK